MDFKQIEAFVNVIRYKSFSRAADASFVTQPTISAHVSALENELDVVLIERKKTEAIPTEAGKQLYKHSVNLINIREQAVREMKKKRSDVDGVLTIQTSSALGEHWLPSKLAEFKRLNPKVKYYVDQSDSSQVEKNIQDGQGELGFIGKKPQYGLKNEVILSDRMVVICPNNEKFSSLHKISSMISIDQIENEGFIWREEGSATRKEFERHLIQLGHKPNNLEAVALINSIEGIKKAVAAGLGISVVSEFSVSNAPSVDNNYLIFSIKEIEIERDFYMIWNKLSAISPTAEAFMEYILKTND
ncbi:MAG: LysR family transcriptional regulator [Tissierellia bacterium]|nr:LysR family transcriptional regulator [Tissierellia bacterium]